MIFLILPANIMRIWELIHTPKVTWGDLLYTGFMYWENFFVATIELQFVIISYSIYLRFLEINIILDNISCNHYDKPMFGDGDVELHITKDIVLGNLGE